MTMHWLSWIAFAGLCLLLMANLIGRMIRFCGRNAPDLEWKPTGIRTAERTWDISRDHDDPRARRQLMQEVKARRVQAERRGDVPHIREVKRRA